MNDKKSIIIIVVVTLLVGVTYFYNSKEDNSPETFVKQKRDVNTHKTTVKELKAIGEKHKVVVEDEKKTVTVGKGRIDSFSNTPSKTWKERLGKKLLRFQKDGTKVVIKEKRRIIQNKSGVARYLEEVIVSYINSDGKINGFTALVDSESGEIIRTWGRVIHKRNRGGTIEIPEQGHRNEVD